MPEVAGRICLTFFKAVYHFRVLQKKKRILHHLVAQVVKIERNALV